MKLAFVVAAASLVPALSACSDPPKEPAQAAVDITVSAAQGSCTGQHGSLTMPRDQRVTDALLCDLTTGCTPGQYVAVDGDTDTQVSCSVTQTAQGYQVRGSIALGGNTFGIAGEISSSGGKATINHYFPTSLARLEGTCDVTIVPNKGLVKPGSVWGKFSCAEFADPTSLGGNNCTASGAFLFERCDGG